MELFVGTSGFSYKEWKGPFYPADLAADRMLAWYAERLPAVEINNTFYRLPTARLLAGWAAEVPEGFRFSIKAARRITHLKRLRGAEEETGHLADVLTELGDRLGVVLFQLPPNLKADDERLAAFLATLPPRLPVAFEFRHPSWSEEPTRERLRGHGAALVLSDTDDDPVTGDLPRTADWGYLRLRRRDYGDDQLAAWAERLRATGWRRAFVFFKHEDEAAGPRLAARFRELAGD